MKRILAIGIPVVLVWLAGLAWLGAREGWWRAAAPLADAPATELHRSLRVLSGDDVVGRVELERTPHADGSVSSAMTARLVLPIFGTTAALDLDADLWRPAAGTDGTSVHLAVRAEDQTMTLDGTVEGGMLRGRVTTAGELMPFEVPLADRLLLATGIGPLADIPPLEAGEVTVAQGLDPISLRAAPIRLRGSGREILSVAGKPVSARIVEIEARGLVARAWVAADGGLLRAETPFGLTFEAIDLDVPGPATATGETGDSGAALRRAITVEPTGRRPRRGAQAMTVAIRGVPGLVVDTRQTRLGDDRWRIVAVPEPGDGADLPAPDEIESLLAGDAFVQARHPRIRRQARALTSLDETPAARAQAIYQWTFESLDKVPVASLPSALAVLESRRGDCNEHTVLFAALARAADLPTRIAIGLVWSEELDAFGYHAWPEVWTGDGWLAMDPTLGQERADATHIKLLGGSVLAWRELLAYLGRIDIEVLEVE